MARGRKVASSESRKRAQTAARESRQRLENQFREDTREKFFQGREDVSDDRLDRRRQQDLAEQRFIRTRMKPVENTGGTLLQKRDPLGMSLEDFRAQNAMKYGPTPKEVFGDIGRGLSSMVKGYGIPFVSTAQRIGGGLKDLYDFMFPKPSVVNYGGSSNITVTEEPQFPYNFETTLKPKPDPLLPSEMSQEQFMESYPELYSGNPLFRQQTYEPIRVSDMDMTGVMASERGQNLMSQLQNLQNLAQQYNLDKVQFDPFNPNRIGYKDQFMFNETPVNYNISATPQGLQGGLSFAFKKGGSVDKYAGLGYKLK